MQRHGEDDMSALEQLRELRDYGGPASTVGLSDSQIERFAAIDPDLGAAITAAVAAHRSLRTEHGAALAGAEQELVRSLQSAYVNFYAANAVNPYVPIAARGPWIVTSHGAVLHDNGGYGMLGMGHAPELRDRRHDVTSPRDGQHHDARRSAHARFAERLRAEIGPDALRRLPLLRASSA